jgi:hypothetical protein
LGFRPAGQRVEVGRGVARSSNGWMILPDATAPEAGAWHLGLVENMSTGTTVLGRQTSSPCICGGSKDGARYVWLYTFLCRDTLERSYHSQFCRFCAEKSLPVLNGTSITWRMFLKLRGAGQCSVELTDEDQSCVVEINLADIERPAVY